MRKSLAVVVLLLAVALAAWVFIAEHRPAAPFAEISGTVFHPSGPVQEALVRLKGKTHSVWTDSKGDFHLLNRWRAGDRVTAWKEGFFIAGIPAAATTLRL